MRILIIEDEIELAKALQRGLKSLGYAVDTAFDGIDGEVKAMSVNYDLIVLDLTLPQKDGIDVCKGLRDHGCTSAVLMLTARSQVSERTLGLDSGADDYLAKPFSFDELRARIQALLRRSFGLHSPAITIGGLSVDPAKRMVCYAGHEIVLTAREFDILEYFACRYPDCISTEEILEHVWNDEVDPFSNVVRVHLANLRRKLKNEAGGPLIETIVGKGYKLWIR